MYTRKGDWGETSLYGSRRVPKDSPRVEAYGAIDELNSVLGLAISLTSDSEISTPLREIQKMLFVAGADAAAEADIGSRVPRITDADTLQLEKMTDNLLKRLPKLENFVIPGGSTASSCIQIGRAVCRRAERRLIAASRSENMNPELIRFFNRLSSYLFNLSRWANKQGGLKDEIWKG